MPDFLPAARWLGTVDYSTAYAKMMEVHTDCVTNRSSDAVLYLEHPEVITLGRASEPEDRASVPEDVQSLEVTRGGRATWHGPGQLVGYCIVDLSNRTNAAPDIRAFLEATEAGILSYLKERWQLPAVMRPDYTGVWIEKNSTFPGMYPAAKIASIGLAVRKWVTYHGFALNLHPDLDRVSRVVPCGIRDAQMTSVAHEAGPEGYGSVSLEAEAATLHEHLSRHWKDAGYCHRDPLTANATVSGLNV